MNPTSSVSPISIKATGASIAGACDRQQKIAGFDQEKFSRSHVLCVGGGGLISNIAPSLARKGIGALTVLDHDEVEVSNLNRQRFYTKRHRAEQGHCACSKPSRRVHLQHRPNRICNVIGNSDSQGIDLTCDVAVCGVDNNSTRVVATQYFRSTRASYLYGS